MSTRCSRCGWVGIEIVSSCPDCGHIEHEDLIAGVESVAREFRSLMERLDRGEKPVPSDVYFPTAAELAARSGVAAAIRDARRQIRVDVDGPDDDRDDEDQEGTP